MDTWNILTDLRGEEVGGRLLEDICRRTRIHIRRAINTDNEVVKARVGVGGGGEGWVMRGKMGDICDGINN